MNNNIVEKGASSYETSTPMKENPESASRNSKAQTLDALKEHINIHELSLVKSLLTPSNGNCWYSAICDQSVSRTSLTNQTLLTEWGRRFVTWHHLYRRPKTGYQTCLVAGVNSGSFWLSTGRTKPGQMELEWCVRPQPSTWRETSILWELRIQALETDSLNWREERVLTCSRHSMLDTTRNGEF